MINTYKSPLRYPGGKSKLVDKIHQFAPNSIEEYREPFFGGGSMLFHLYSIDKKPEIVLIGDTFDHLITFWKMIRTSSYMKHVKITIEDWKKHFSNNGKELYNHCHVILKNNHQYSYTDQAVAFFILNRISFSGLTLSGGYSKTSFEKRLTENSIQKIEKAHNVLESTYIYNTSYNHLLFSKTNTETNKVWIYMDPPYDIKPNNLYGNRGNQHKEFDHIKFAEDCKQSPYKWLISYNDNERIRELFEWANIQTIQTSHLMNSKNKQKNELIITNY